MNEHTNTGAPSARTATTVQTAMLVLLRVAIGWHFLYEGISKLYTPGWTSQSYLSVSKWIFSGFFNWIAANPFVLRLVDLLNMWGLTLIGLGLMLGCCTRIASISGIVLIFLYYVANPPFIGMDFGVITEGNYLYVDKNLVELFALCVLVLFPTGRMFGLDRLIAQLRRKQAVPAQRSETESAAAGGSQSPEKSPKKPASSVFLDRREMIKSLATVPFFGAFVIAVLRKRGWESYEENQLKNRPDAISSATIKTFNFASLKELKGQIPRAKIRDLEVSRVILGGNLIGGWAHARDLIYVSKLVKAYYHKSKIFETFLLAEKCGITAFLTNPVLCGVISEYWKRNIGKIQFISDCGGKDIFDGIKVSIDAGASACYVHGGIADNLAKEGKVEYIGKALDLIKKNGLPAGIGAHSLDTVKACLDIGLEPDFWMKTLHKTDYWSARPGEAENDNIWCTDPEGTIEIMKTQKQPWIAYKILAAGAIEPKEGFTYAFDNGADFICVGMYDFQIVEDVNIALEVLTETLRRQRPWIA